MEEMQHVLACFICSLGSEPDVRTILIVPHTLTIYSFLDVTNGNSCDVAGAKDEHIVKQVQDSFYGDKGDCLMVQNKEMMI